MGLSQEQVEQWLALLTMNVFLLTAVLSEIIMEGWEKIKIEDEKKNKAR